MKHYPPEQLNMPDAPREYQLEDILQEFGKPQPEQAAETVEKAERVETAEKVKKAEPSLKSDTIRFTPIRSKPKALDADAPVKLAPGAAKSAEPPVSSVSPVSPAFPATPVLPKQERTAAFEPAPETPTLEAPEAPAPEDSGVKEQIALPQTPYTLFERYRKGSVAQIFRFGALLLLALCAVFLLVYAQQELQFFPPLNRNYAAVCLCVLGLSVLLAGEVFLQGVRELLCLRFSLYLIAFPIAVLAVLHGVSALHSGGDNYCPVAVLLLFYLQYALRLERSAMVHTLYSVCEFSKPLGIFEAPQKATKNDSLRCAPADMDDYLEKLTLPDRTKTVFSVYSLLLLPLSAGLAIALSRVREVELLQCWLLLLLAGTPWAAMLSFAKPFRALARRLSRQGSALAGWHSAKVFGKSHTVILRDEDLFPRKDISSNGMKLYGAFSAPFVISNALAVLDAVESPLVDVFQELLAAHNGARMYASSYRLYDNDGIGAEVNGEDVLLGSLSFMRSMGVHMPSGARVRQAVYLSVRGELCGVFAIRHKPNPASKRGLRGILTNENFSVVIAARDFLVTPELIAAKYELPTDRIVFPDYNIRVRLTEVDPNVPTLQGALLAEKSFGAFAATVAAGRTLRVSTYLSAVLSLLAGLGGLALCAALFFWNTGISPVHLALFQLVWTLLIGLCTDIRLKF